MIVRSENQTKELTITYIDAGRIKAALTAAQLNTTNTTPTINPAALAQHLNIPVHHTDLPGLTLTLTQGAAAIHIGTMPNASHTRKTHEHAYALAHAIGHYYEQTLLRPDRTVTIHCQATRCSAPSSQYATAFASELLAPREVIRALAAATGGSTVAIARVLDVSPALVERQLEVHTSPALRAA